jgi:hypothetical protein
VAHLHFRRTVYKTGSGKASARLEYIQRQPALTRSAEQHLRYITRVEHEGREDLVATGSRNMPAWAEENPHVFFQAAEQYERQGGVAFEEWKVTLPVELSRDQNGALIEDLLDTIAGDRLPITYAFHAPMTLDGTQEQPHVHLLLSTRMNDGRARSAVTHFKRWNKDDPARGGAQKDPAMNNKGAVKAHRLMIADVVNVHLEYHGQVARVHPDTLEQRGIARAPEPKLLPSESAAYREKGLVGETMAAVLKVRAHRGTTRTRENNQAWQAWEARKAFLGITRGMSQEEKFARILRRRHGAVERVPTRYRALAQGQARTRQHPARDRSPRAMLAQLQAMTARWGDGKDLGTGYRMRVRLQEEQGQGMGW